MQIMNTKLLWRSIVPRCTGFLVLTTILALFSGCSHSVKEGVSVEGLNDGREGFVIRETSSMDEESLEDFEQAVAMMEELHYDEAIELFEQVIERSPGVTAPYVNIAMAYVQIDKLELAEEHLKTALSLVPDHPAVSNEYGLLLRKSGRFTEAREIYENTLEVYPEYLPAQRNLGILCDLYINDLGCALEQYEIYSEAMPGDEKVKMWIADLRMRLGR